MTNLDESQVQTLCKACGMCCNGSLFAWVRLNANELDRSEALGLNVIRNDPRQRGFTQPCPMWNGTCTIYTSLDYPRSCGTYKCKVLRQLLDEDISLPDALTVVQDTLEMIRSIDLLLPASPSMSFRERLITFKEELEKRSEQDRKPLEQEFLLKAGDLLTRYEDRFGVDDFIDYDS
ncbi:MAG: hypothetical protein U0Z26_03390 [Anaerolineales bacterium]